jgi:hypothetical protein
MKKVLLIGTLVLCFVTLFGAAPRVLYAQFPWSGICFVDAIDIGSDANPSNLTIFATVSGETFTICATATGFAINNLLVEAQSTAVPIRCSGTMTPGGANVCGQGFSVQVTKAGL